MNLVQNLQLAVIEYLNRGRRAVPLQTFTTRHSNRKLSIICTLEGYTFQETYWIIVYCFFCVFVKLRITPPRIKLAASHFAQRFIDVQGRESHIFVNFAPQKAQNRTNRSASGPRPSSCNPLRYWTVIRTSVIRGDVTCCCFSLQEVYNSGSQPFLPMHPFHKMSECSFARGKFSLVRKFLARKK